MLIADPFMILSIGLYAQVCETTLNNWPIIPSYNMFVAFTEV